ncbi:MAG: SGNH/GDSL hydrolase family protein, partial [Pseudomonadota bacterium]
MKMRFAVMALAALPLVSGAAQASTLSPVAPFLVFGDSLSDPGNILPGGLQFTNGDAWASQLGADLASGMNFAVGGATAADSAIDSDFDDQIAAFRGSGARFNSDTSTVVWFGGNDLLDLPPGPTPADVFAAVNDVMHMPPYTGTVVDEDGKEVVVAPDEGLGPYRT